MLSPSWLPKSIGLSEFLDDPSWPRSKPSRQQSSGRSYFESKWRSRPKPEEFNHVFAAYSGKKKIQGEQFCAGVDVSRNEGWTRATGSLVSLRGGLIAADLCMVAQPH